MFRIRALLLLFSLSLKLQAITTENLSEINKFPEINSHFDSTKSISIITPNGGENWQIDNWFAIFWQQTNMPDAGKISSIKEYQTAFISTNYKLGNLLKLRK